MRLFTAAWLLVLVSCASSPDGGTKENAANTASIEGTVRDAGSNDPIAGANVFVVRGLDQLQVRVLSDAEGRFLLPGLDPGRHTLAVTRDSYVVSNRQEISGYPFQLKSGERLKDVVLPMVHAGSIAGRVFRQDGTPAPRVEVQLLQNLYLMGRLQWSEVTRGGSSRDARITTNDRGEFQATGVDPGSYVIRFAPRELTVESRVPGGVSAVPMLYPEVHVQPGRETLLNDVKLKTARRAWVRVSVINQSGESLEGFGSWTFKPQDWIGSNYPLVEDRITDSFHEFQPDSPGVYDITATWSSPGGRLTGTARVHYRGADIDVQMPVTKASAKVTGRIVLRDGTDEARPVAGAEIAIGPRISYFGRTGPDGAFVLPGVYSGRYLLGYVRGLPVDAFVLSAKQGARDLFKEEMVIESGEERLEITGSTGAPVLVGTVTDANGRAIHNALVVLVPDSPLRERKDYYGAFKDTRTDQNGMFEIRGITPGEYQAFAWRGAPSNAFRNAEFMKPFAGKGTPLKLALNGKATADLTLLD
ncbi:MAG TPA: carboxypeptidase-like regulatory domain-containing protein [Terriglobia bacterium]|nr:carboxypeptidase-like regulatory domain-containing protein [Terriglobia bacterium]